MPIVTLNSEKITWVNIQNPQQEDIEVIRRNYPFHSLELEDCLSTFERPKIDEHENYLFIVMQLPYYDINSKISKASQVSFFIGEGYVVTIHDGGLPPINRLFQDCQLFDITRTKYMGQGAGRLLHDIIDGLVDYCEPFTRKVDRNISRIEDSIFGNNMRKVVEEISIVRRDIIALRRIIKPQIPIVRNLESVDRPFIRGDLDIYFSDIVDHLSKIWDLLDELYEVVGGLSATSDSVISYRINNTMRILTVISVIMLPLTLITGFFGMNVKLPMAEMWYAWLSILGGMAFIAISMLLLFKKWRIV